MRQIGYFANPAGRCFVGCVLLVMVATAVHRIYAETVEINTSKDNTLFQYNPADYEPAENKSWIKSNGKGNFFGAGRNYGRDQIQRGLLRFDIDSAGIPAGSTVDSVALRLYVVDVPKKDSTPRDFWLVALPTFTQEWGEAGSIANVGTSGGGGGSGADPEPGDATWFHTQYDPTDPAHYDTTVPSGDSPWQYYAGSAGFWPQGSVVSPAGLPLDLGQGALGSDEFIIDPADYAPTAEDVGGIGFVEWSTVQMAEDVQRWIDDPAGNFGWIVLGDESVKNDPGGTKRSSKRGFASFDNLDLVGGIPVSPLLTVQYTPSSPDVPEPSSCLLGLLAVTGMGLYRWCRRAK